MKSFKILTPLALSLALGAFAVPEAGHAQGSDSIEGAEARPSRGNRGRRGHARRGHRGHRMMAELNLSDSQKEQMRAIRQGSREEMRQLRQAERTPANRAALRALRTENRRLRNEVLTPAQQTQLETLRATHRSERQTRRIEGMTTRLSLTPDQVGRITSIFEQASTARNQAQRNEDRRAAMRAVREQTRAAINNVLTDEQKAVRATHRSERGERGQRGRRGRRGGR